jgi:hypothetical protein
VLSGFLGQLLGGSGRGSVGGIHATVGADISDYERKMRQADQTMKRTASSMTSELDKSARMISGGLGGIGGAIGIGGALVLAQQIGSAVTELNALGAESQRMSAAFVEQWGERAPAAMETLRAASHGTISDMDLMLSANRAQMLHVTDDYNELGRLLEVATARGRAMGLTTQQAFSDLVTGIGRISPLILDNLGILTGGEATFTAYAASIGKAGQELTDVEKRQALVDKVLEQSVDVAVDAAGKMETLKAAKVNLRMEIGSLITDVIAETEAVDTLTASLEKMRSAMEYERNASAQANEMTAEFTANLERQISAAGMNEQLYQRMTQGQRNLEVAYRDGRITAEQYQTGINALDDELRAATGQMSRAEIAAADLREENDRAARAAWGVARGYMAAGNAASTMADQVAAAARLVAASQIQYSEYGYQIYGSATNSYTAVQQRVEYLQIENERAVIERQNAQGRVDEAEKTEKAILDAQKSAGAESLRMAEQQFDALRGIVESALSPTAVTAADLAATAAGTYLDKWDEYMRRARMPESGLSADAIAEQERLFYSGQMMDQINWGAVVSDVQRKVQEEASREAMIQEAMRQVQMAGIGATQSQVAGALGVTDYAAIGQEQQQALAAGFRADGLAVTFTDQFEDELGQQQERWVTMGTMSVEWMAEGIERGATPEVTHRLINLLVPGVAEVLTGGARP